MFIGGGAIPDGVNRHDPDGIGGAVGQLPDDAVHLRGAGGPLVDHRLGHRVGIAPAFRVWLPLEPIAGYWGVAVADRIPPRGDKLIVERHDPEISGFRGHGHRRIGQILERSLFDPNLVCGRRHPVHEQQIERFAEPDERVPVVAVNLGESNRDIADVQGPVLPVIPLHLGGPAGPVHASYVDGEPRAFGDPVCGSRVEAWVDVWPGMDTPDFEGLAAEREVVAADARAVRVRVLGPVISEVQTSEVVVGAVGELEHGAPDAGIARGRLVGVVIHERDVGG